MEHPDAVSDPGHPRILVIDDDAGIRLLVRLNFEQHGFAVVQAEDGVAGIAAARDQRPDAIVLDLMMPGMDGFQALTELRSDHRTRDVPVVILTAVALTTSREWAYDLGADAVITKPFHPEELMSVVATLVDAGRPAERQLPGVPVRPTP